MFYWPQEKQQIGPIGQTFSGICLIGCASVVFPRAAGAAPKAPTNLVATAVSTNQINLSWADTASNETGFKIERAPDNAGSPGTWSQIATVGVNVVTYSNIGLAASTKYWYRVRSFNNSGNSEYSNQASATTFCSITITTQPISQLICVSNTATFTVGVAGQSLGYQWRRDGTNFVDGVSITGATTATLVLSNVGSSSGISCVTVPSSSSGVNWGNVVAGQTYVYQVSGCIGVNVGCGGPCQTAGPDGDTYNGNSCSGTPTNSPTNPSFLCSSLLRFSLVGKVNGTCIQLGKNGSFVAPSTGALFLYFNDDIYNDNSGSWNACIGSVNPPGGYDVIVTSGCDGAVTSSVASLTVGAPAAITIQPLSQSICEGQPAAFSVTATGDGLHYLWRKNGVATGGAADSNSYTIAASTPSDSGGYDVLVSSSCGAVATSGVANLTVGGATTITGQPTPVNACAGSTTNFAVVGSGAGLTYQWRRDGVNLSNGGNISGATSSTLTISNVTSALATSTCVTVDGSASGGTTWGSVVAGRTYYYQASGCIGINVGCGGPCASSEPDGHATSGGSCTGTNIPTSTNPNFLCPSLVAFSLVGKMNGTCIQLGKSGAFTAPSTGSLVLYFNDDIYGDNSGSWNVCIGTNLVTQGVYDVVVSGSCASPVMSDPATLTISAPPSVSSQPVSQTKCAGQSANFTVAATGTALHYTWRKGGVNLGALDTNVFTIATVSTNDAGAYDVVVSGACSPAATSSVATLTVRTLPTATVSGSATICSNQSTTIQAVLAGAAPWNLMWSDGVSQNGVASSPASRVVSPPTNTTYTVTDVSDANCTGTSSGSAVVTVNPRPTATVSGTATICAGQSTTIQAALTGTAPWNLTWSDGSNQTGVATSPATRNVSPPANTTYSVTVVSDANCTGTSSGSAAISISNPCLITGTSVVCAQSTNQTYTAPSGAGLSYLWGIGGSGTINGSSTAQSVFVNAGSAGSFTLTLTVISGTCSNTCSTMVSVTDVTTITAQPVALTVCSGAAATFTVDASGGSLTYQWRQGGTNLTNGGNISGATSPTLTVSNLGLGAVVCHSVAGSSSSGISFGTVTAGQLYTYQASGCIGNNVGCGGPCSTADPDGNVHTNNSCGGAVVVGTTNPSFLCPSLVPFSLVGKVNGTCIQLGKNGSFIAPSSGALLLYFNDDIYGDNSGSWNVCVTPGSVGSGASFDVVVAGSCGQQISDAATLTINTAPSITSQPVSQNVCAGQSASFAVTGSGTALHYTWRKNSSPIGGAADTNFYAISSVATNDAGPYDVIVSGACSPAATSTVATLTVPTNAPPTAVVSGSTTICSNQSAVIQAALTGVSPWALTWSDGVVQSGVTSSPATRTVSPITNTTYSVGFVSDSNCSGTSSGSATITVNPRPTAVVSGSASICFGGSAVIQAALTGTAPWNLTWSDGSNQTGIAASPATHTVSPTVTTSYSVTAVSDANCAGFSSGGATITIRNPCGISGPKTVCAQSTQNTFSGNQLAGLGYSWSVSGNGTIPGSTTGRVVTVTTGNAGSLTVFLTTISGNCSNTCSSTVTVNPLTTIIAQPVSQTICKTICAGSTMSLSVGATGTNLTYQWRKNSVNLTNGGTVSGATSPTLTLSNVSAITSNCVTVSAGNSSGTSWGAVTAGQVYPYQASGCAGINVGCSGPCQTADPDGNTYNGGSCGGTATNGATNPNFLCPSLIRFSLVGKVNGQCVQLGKNSAFTAPSTGTLTLYLNDDIYDDNSGSWNVCIATTNAASYDCVVSGLCGSQTSSSAVLAVVSGSACISLSVTSPADNSYTTNASVVVNGTATSSLGIAGVSVNATPASSTNAFGNWTATVSGLGAGTNTLTAIATDNAMPANSTTNTLHVIYASGSFDGNGDGLPDAWQIRYFGSVTNSAAAATNDADGDGMNNLQEFLAGTDPTNSASALRIVSIVATNSDVLVIWTTAGGHTNVVQTASSPGAAFSDVGPNITITGTGDAITNYLDAGGATNRTIEFYRIRLVP